MTASSFTIIQSHLTLLTITFLNSYRGFYHSSFSQSAFHLSVHWPPTPAKVPFSSVLEPFPHAAVQLSAFFYPYSFPWWVHPQSWHHLSYHLNGDNLRNMTLFHWVWACALSSLRIEGILILHNIMIRILSYSSPRKRLLGGFEEELWASMAMNSSTPHKQNKNT